MTPIVVAAWSRSLAGSRWPALGLAGLALFAAGCGAKTELERPVEPADAGGPGSPDDRGGRDDGGAREDAEVLPDGLEVVERTFPVAGVTDDALQDPGGAMLVRYEWISLYSTAHRGGVRFELTDVPRGAAVLDAWLEVYIDSTREDDPADSIRRDDRTDPPAFSEVWDDIGSRPLSPEDVRWLDTGVGDGWVRSPSLVSLVQPVLDDPDYLPGHAVVLVFVPLPEADDARAFEFRQLDHPGSYGARLVLRFLDAS